MTKKKPSRHCEERSDEAIQCGASALDCFASLAMTQIGTSPRTVIYGIYAAGAKENRPAFNDFIIGDKNAPLTLPARAARTGIFDMSPMESMRVDCTNIYL